MRVRALMLAARLVMSLGLISSCVSLPDVSAAPSKAPSKEETPDSIRSESPQRAALGYTVRVRNRSCEGLGIGSGFLVDERTLITNRHVVQGATSLSVSTWDGRELSVRADEQASIADLAVIHLSSPIAPVADLAGADAQPGASVLIAGYPHGGPADVLAGEILGYTDGAELGNTAKVMQLAVDIQPGNSGGPVVDLDGNVVGVVYAVQTGTAIGLSVPLSTLRAAIDSKGFTSQPTSC